MSISDDFKAAGEQYAADIRAQREAAEHAREQAREQQQHLTSTGGDWLKAQFEQLDANKEPDEQAAAPDPTDNPDDIFNHLPKF